MTMTGDQALAATTMNALHCSSLLVDAARMHALPHIDPIINSLQLQMTTEQAINAEGML